MQVHRSAMGDVINLNRFRKAREKVARAGEADANRHKFGRTKAAKTAEEQDEARRTARRDGAKREEKVRSRTGHDIPATAGTSR